MVAKELNDEGARALLRSHIEVAGSMQAFCDKHDLSYTYISKVVNGREAPSSDLLKAIGLERVTIYRRVA